MVSKFVGVARGPSETSTGLGSGKSLLPETPLRETLEGLLAKAQHDQQAGATSDDVHAKTFRKLNRAIAFGTRLHPDVTDA